jgi:ubiquinone/menaquinone biosynthesis C-methylase UbiE
MKILTHEDKVEIFYSHGSDIRGTQEGGFLSFGYWTEDTIDYHQAVEALINRMLRFEKPLNSGMVLNVACGYGAETLKIYDKLHPDEIYAIDITSAHVEFAKHHIQQLNLSSKIHFEKMNACKLHFEPNSFDYVIGIEGPAHFNTRKLFLRKAYEVLKPGGILLLSDIIVNDVVTRNSIYNRIIGSFCAKHWHMPKENWMPIGELKTLMETIGYKIDNAESAGNNIYPGFSKFNLKWDSLKNAFRTRGFRIGLALSFISWLLGYVHRRNMIDYVLIRAIKI